MIKGGNRIDWDFVVLCLFLQNIVYEFFQFIVYEQKLEPSIPRENQCSQKDFDKMVYQFNPNPGGSKIAPFPAYLILHLEKVFKSLNGAPQGRLEIPLSRMIFAQFTPRNCLKFIFTSHSPYHTGCQIDLPHSNAICFIQFPFSRSQ